ncbi:hypothetical protein QBC35DRAFT_495862 [Podospora australis]|uniref:Uncharacterized protein n=1 Tax=Podospora australis TaxID=1536484 RepID=A0AAN6WY16_9PEZI|nr:hypothetical protein QBC35DRAFT_495862 [Podospora australis]
MGLALYNSPSHPPSFPLGGDDVDADEDGSQGLGLDHRYLPGHAGPSFRDPANPKARHVRKPFKWDTSKIQLLQAWSLDPETDLQADGWRPHEILAIQSVPPLFKANDVYGLGCTARDIAHGRGKAKLSERIRRQDEYQEAYTLARDGRIRLPFDEERRRSQRRPPSLERQDAFRDGRTTKRKRIIGEEDIVSDDELRKMGLLYDDNDEDAQQTKELYVTGLLYDDEHLRGERFTLETIQREEPVYAIKTQLKKKNQRRRNGQKLEMSLDFSVLGDDEELASLLTACAEGRTQSAATDLSTDSDAVRSQAATGAQQQHGNAPLKVIYELVEEEETAEEDAWDMVDDGMERLNGYNNAEPSLAEVVMEEGGTKDPWVVLNLDGS